MKSLYWRIVFFLKTRKSRRMRKNLGTNIRAIITQSTNGLFAVDPEDLEWMYDNVESDSMHLATLQFQNAFINETVDSIGFRLRGNTSRNADKKSFKVDFNHFISGREFYGLQKLNLNGEHNDPSIIRSKLSWDFYEDIGMKSSRASHATLYINND